MKRLSLYKNNGNVTFSRRLIIFLLDYMIMLFITMILFLMSDSILTNAKNSKLNKINESTSSYQVELIKIMEESNLGYGSDNSINDSSIISDKYVFTIVYESLNGDVIDKSIYEPKMLKVNSLDYYYGTYKVNNSSLYLNYSKNETGITYINNLFVEKVNVNNDIISIQENKIIMNEQYAKAIDNFICLAKDSITIDDKVYNGSDTYSIIYKAYNELLQNAKEDIMTNHKNYLETFNNFNESRNKMVGYKWGELVIVYVIVSLIYFIGVPLINKNRATLSMILFYMVPCSKDGYSVGIGSIIIKGISEVIMYLNVTTIILTFLYNINSRLFLQYKLFGVISMSSVYIVSTIYLIVCLVMSALKSSKYQTIGDKLSNQLIKDSRE